jgi:hypothetical protein
MTTDFTQADAHAALIEERSKAQESRYETLLSKYQCTTVSAAGASLSPTIGRALDILRHEYLNCIYDIRLWKLRTNDSYAERRLKAMQEFLAEFDKAFSAQEMS